MKNMYCGYVRNTVATLFDNGCKPPIFEVTCIKTTGRDEDLKYTAVDGCYYIGTDVSFHCIPDTYLDQEIDLSFGKIMYSFDKQKCIDLVNSEYQNFKESVDRYIKYLQNIQNCQVKISEEQDGYKNGC